jgi:hypothetical protein
MKVLSLFLLFTIISLNLASANDVLSLSKYQDQKLKIQDINDTITNGKGVWVNVWNYPKDTNAFISRLKTYNIDTVYLQINRSTTDVFKDKAGVDALLQAAHQVNIKIIGWSYCYLKDINADAKKFTEPALYTSPEGQKLDGMAADIEENTNLWAVRSYTEKIKSKLPKDYPLIAIVYSPRIKSVYPWEYIASNWDILMPMTYWHGLKNRNQETVYNFVKDSISQLRALTKKDDLKIHLITDGDRTSTEELKTSLKAARDLNVNAGISIYPEHLASDEMLNALAKHCKEGC